MVILCEYGCNQEAKYQFKNGKWCCSKNIIQCPTIRKQHSVQKEKLWKDVNSGYNSILCKKKKSKALRKAWKDPNSKLNSVLRGERISKSWKKIWKDPKSGFNLRKRSKLTIKKINEKYPFFSQIEEMRYNPDKPGEKELQVHCKNHLCENSKEQGGWFTPNKIQLSDRINQLEHPKGNDGSFFYCSQECKNSCSLFNLKSDPFKNTERSYTEAERNIWREKVLELDSYKCQYCGEKATDAHHEKPVKTHPYLTLDPDNGIACCEGCHYKYGHKTGTECSTGKLAAKIC